MIIVDHNTIMADLLSDYNELIPVLNRFGIKLGVGNKSIKELCIDYDLNLDLVINVLNVYLNKDFISDETVDKIEIESIVDYFQKTIDNYINDLIPNIEKHLNAFVLVSDTKTSELGVLKELFTKFRDRMSENLQDISNYDEDLPDELLHDLKNILIKHISGDYNQNLTYAVIFSIHSFEQDLAAHNRLRNKVLRPVLEKLNSSDIIELQSSLQNELHHKPESPDYHLTNRETEILKLIVQGNQNKEIADMLNISLNTVLTHRKNIISKTGIKTVSGLTFYSLRKGLISM